MKLRRAERDEIVDLLYEHKTLSKVCEVTGYALRDIMEDRDEDNAFDDQIKKALSHLSVLGEEELMRRAIYGVEEPIISRGRQATQIDPETGQRRYLTKRVFSDSLLLAYLKARMKEQYGDKVEIETTHKGHIALPVISPDDFEKFLQMAQQKQLKNTDMLIEGQLVRANGPKEKDDEEDDL